MSIWVRRFSTWMEEYRRLRFLALPLPSLLWSSMNVCAVLHARVGHGRPRAVPHHHGVVLPRRARRHPRYDRFLPLSPYPHPRLTRFLISPHSPLLATRLIRVMCATRMGVMVIRYSVRRVESRVVRGPPAMAGRARELRPARSRQNRCREQARQGKKPTPPPIQTIHLARSLFLSPRLALMTRDMLSFVF